MVTPERLKPLLADVSKFRDEQRARHTLNFAANWALVVSALLSTVLVAVGGILEWPHKYIALIGIVGTAMVALQNALAISDKAEFQRILASDAENLLLYLQDPALADDDFAKYRDQFIKIRSEGDRNLPKGGGVEAARKLPPIGKAT